jgi:hypothetical protein
MMGNVQKISSCVSILSDLIFIDSRSSRHIAVPLPVPKLISFFYKYIQTLISYDSYKLNDDVIFKYTTIS